MRTSEHVDWLRHKTTRTTISHHYGRRALLTTAVGSRCATSETKGTGVGVLSRVLDFWKQRQREKQQSTVASSTVKHNTTVQCQKTAEWSQQQRG